MNEIKFMDLAGYDTADNSGFSGKQLAAQQTQLCPIGQQDMVKQRNNSATATEMLG